MKLKGPSLSPAASGSLADVLTFSHGKKNPYAKQHAAPHNPHSPAQTGVRAMVSFLSKIWSTLSPADQATWQPLAEDFQIAPYHAFMAQNMKRWRTFRFPTKAYPAAETPVALGAVWQWAYGGKAHIRIELNTAPGPKPWGYITFRQPNPFPDPTTDKCVAVLPHLTPTPIVWYDTPLAAGPYWYRTQSFTDTGYPRSPSAQDSATAT